MSITNDSKISTVSLQDPDADQTSGTQNSVLPSQLSNQKSPAQVPDPAGDKPSKAELATNAPAHMEECEVRLTKVLKYFGRKRVDWFGFTAECEGSGEFIQRIATDLPVSSGPLSRPKNQQYSIFEAQPAAWQWQSNFVEAQPSDQAKGRKAPILSRQAQNCWGWVAFFAAFTTVRIGLFVSQCLQQSQNNTLIALFSLVGVLECSIYAAYSQKYSSGIQKLVVNLKDQMLKQSATLATALPRMLISECGHAKFLKKQLKFPFFCHWATLFMLTVSMFCSSISLSTVSQSIPMYKISVNLSKTGVGLLFLGLQFIPTCLSFILTLVMYHYQYVCTKHSNRSIVSNLRGFMLSDGYALDFSMQHQIDEGLCYLFNEAPSLYIPYLAVRAASVHLEPIRMKIQYKFSVEELQQLDSRSNIRAREVLKRGFDQYVFDDIQIYVVLELQTDVRIWIPLSLTQLQQDRFAKSSMFGFTGLELSTVLKMIASQILENDDDKKSIDQVAQFCLNYQHQRQQSVAEEALHIQVFDTIIVPIGEE